MKTADIGLSFEHCGIADVLYRWQLVVPLNQRPYAWEDDEVEKLFHDLTKAVDTQPIYFLGTIMFTKGESNDTEVADGQQRLATTSILIAAMRDYLIELGDEKGAKEYQSDYLVKYDPPTGLYRQKLALNAQDNQFFNEQMLLPPDERKPATAGPFTSHSLLLAAAEKARAHVRDITAGLDNSAKTAKLHRWVSYLKEQALIIVVTVPAHIGNSFKMFETLNARGATASQVDILKNFLFERAPKHAQQVHSHWISMLSIIELQGDDTLLLSYIRHLWVSLRGPTTKDDLGSAIEGQVKNEGDALSLVSTLDTAAGEYVAILNPLQSARWEGLKFGRQALDLLSNGIGVEQIRPLVLAVARHFDPLEMDRAFQLFLSWSVRFLISGGGGGGKLDRYYGEQAKAVTNRQIKTATELAAAMSEVVPSDARFQEAFATASVSKANLARYYLRAVELHRGKDPSPQFLINEDPLAVNLEHILPIKPDNDWDVPAETAAVFYKRLGNMVLLPSKVNVEAGNKSFDAKKPFIEKSMFSITREVLTLSKWGPDQITERQKKLALEAPLVWPLKWK
ncbi:hypothetical protein FHS85_004012 [Rhodoligotrophos appendicifer]|uniref:DUF262 domain-containing protein n=1 Tax=Rhodoligotrophos appendicifer TaxID=987056 RepID=UPI0014782C68|nr:DUF262 domain-containing protein [Rhodoligotrophos appendicifer]